MRLLTLVFGHFNTRERARMSSCEDATLKADLSFAAHVTETCVLMICAKFRKQMSYLRIAKNGCDSAMKC